jgi:hypothetical protein
VLGISNLDATTSRGCDDDHVDVGEDIHGPWNAVGDGDAVGDVGSPEVINTIILLSLSLTESRRVVSLLRPLLLPQILRHV